MTSRELEINWITQFTEPRDIYVGSWQQKKNYRRLRLPRAIINYYYETNKKFYMNTPIVFNRCPLSFIEHATAPSIKTFLN